MKLKLTYTLILILNGSLLFAQTQDQISDKPLKKSRYDFLQNTEQDLSFQFSDLADGTIHFRYEKSINEKWSIALGLAYKTPEGLLYLSGINDGQFQTSNLSYQGWKVIPEIRYYVDWEKHRARTGFYVGAYSKFSFYNSNLEGNFSDNEGNRSKIGTRADLNIYSLGIMLGYKWSINPRWAIDFTFLGYGKGWYTMKLNPYTEIPDSFYEYVNGVLDQYSILDLINSDFDFSPNQINSNFWGVSARYGISLNYSF